MTRGHFITGEYETAYHLIEEVIAYQKKAEEGYITMAKWYIAQGRYEEAFSYINEKILGQFPSIYENESFLFLMGDLYMRTNEPQKAEYYWEELCRIREKDPEYLYYLANCYSKENKTEEAKEIIEEMRKINADSELIRELEESIN